jgi:hypothetical protein
MVVRWGIEDGQFAFMEFSEAESAYTIGLDLGEYAEMYEIFAYHPTKKKYDRVMFTNSQNLGQSTKAVLRKTWKSLQEQGWREYNINTKEDLTETEDGLA